MKDWQFTLLGAAFSLCVSHAQSLQLPQTPLIAGNACAIPTSGIGKGVLYISGPGQSLRRDVEFGQPVSLAAGELYGAGHYLATVVNGSSIRSSEFDVVPRQEPGSLGFLAKPSRLPVSIHNGISGTIYVFDKYHNLVMHPLPASLELAGAGGSNQIKFLSTRNGVAWTSMDSAAKEGAVRFSAHVGVISSTRVIKQVAGDPCSITIHITPQGKRLEVQTSVVHDCSGNIIPDGTVVTFTEVARDTKSTVDVPLKQGVARVLMPAMRDSKISVASGAVAGNEISWQGTR